MIKVDELAKYVERMVIPRSLNGLNNKTLNYVPPNAKPLQSFTRVIFSPDDIKRIYINF